ncbi:NAD(P)-binding domain-containing protein [Bacteroidales bacterium]|nr:NAD(P)-binding domain-containing protein [Bacteroidales bacterium]
MAKVLIATEKPFSGVAVNGIKEIAAEKGHEIVLLEKYADKAALLEAVADAEALIIRSDKIDSEVLSAAKNLKIVVRAGAGYDNVDLEAATANDVVVMNTPGQNANAVAELAFGLIISTIRNSYNGKAGFELKGKKLGIHAYGNIGKIVAGIAKGFGMEVFAFDPFVTKEAVEADGVGYIETVEELYKTCQFVSLNLPATDKTKKSINQALLSTMPANSVLINTARKEVIDEEGLAAVLAEKSDFYYTADVAPASAAELKEKYDTRVFFTAKKMGAQTAEANFNAGIAAINQISNFLANGDVTFKVN